MADRNKQKKSPVKGKKQTKTIVEKVTQDMREILGNGIQNLSPEQQAEMWLQSRPTATQLAEFTDAIQKAQETLDAIKAIKKIIAEKIVQKRQKDAQARELLCTGPVKSKKVQPIVSCNN